MGNNRPYEDLYVYLVEGLVNRSREVFLGPHFIGTWVEDDSSFLFFSKPSRRWVMELLDRDPRLRLVEEHRFSYEDWHGGPFEPVRVERFLITPYWVNGSQAEGEIPIVLDPGVVFGTGLHPTTRDCLRALLALGDRTFPGTVLDLGTGTGILAVASALLGVERVLAVDLNPLCVETARRNAALNGCDKIIEVHEGKAQDFVHLGADLVIANLHYGVLKELVETMALWEKKWVVISGLLRSQSLELKARLSNHPFHLLHEWNHENTWTTLLGESRAR